MIGGASAAQCNGHARSYVEGAGGVAAVGQCSCGNLEVLALDAKVGGCCPGVIRANFDQLVGKGYFAACGDAVIGIVEIHVSSVKGHGAGRVVDGGGVEVVTGLDYKLVGRIAAGVLDVAQGERGGIGEAQRSGCCA
ncbi:hypothetical protein D3C78_1182530 [compost metagenome]